MGRPLRAFHEGLYHVAARASDARYLYLTADDYRSFLDRLAATCRRFDLDLVSYVLMGTHYHGIFRIRDARLSAALQELHTGYSWHHNRVHRREAHLFRAHCFARRIGSSEQLLTTVRYVSRNPVKAGLVPDACAWRWSSARAHAGIEPAQIPLEEGPIYAAFDRTPDWRRRYRAIVETGSEVAFGAAVLAARRLAPVPGVRHRF